MRYEEDSVIPFRTNANAYCDVPTSTILYMLDRLTSKIGQTKAQSTKAKPNLAIDETMG